MKQKQEIIVIVIIALSILCVPARVPGAPPEVSREVYEIVNKAQQMMKDEHYDKAEQILKHFIKTYPQKCHYLTEFTLANALSLSGKDNEALMHYRSTVALCPEFSYAWQNMGKIYFDIKQYIQAGDCILKGYEISETRDYSLLYFAAVSYCLAQEYKKALPHLTCLVSGEAGSPRVEWLEAFLQVCMELHLKDEAFRVVNLLLDKDGGNPRWWKILAQFHLQDNNYKEGVAALTIYSYLSPLKKDELLLLGNLSSTIGLPLKASHYYEQFISMHEDVQPADYERLASAYLAGHRPAKAEDTLRWALKETPTFGLWSMLGYVFYEEEKFDEAYRAFEQASHINRKDGKIHLMMGYCALQSDEKEKARTAFQEAARYSKQKKQAKKMLKQLDPL
jgi:tetratricopeptide (TPR) repeat protein